MEMLDIVNENDEVIGTTTQTDAYAQKLPHRIGHVQTTEDYQTAAQREYQEEIGAQSELELVSKDLYCDQNGINKFLATFKTVYIGKFNINPIAVDEVRYFTIEELRTMIADNEKIHPELLFLLKKYYL